MDSPDKSDPSPENDTLVGKSRVRNWEGYIYEFLMLFLAVTLGFFVDNLREDRSDRTLEKQHIVSLTEDLRQDTALYHRQIQDLRFVVTCADSVVLLLQQKERSEHDMQRLYYLTRRIAPKIRGLYMNDRTFEEMRSSGNLRLINRKNVSDSISTYYFNGKELSYLSNIASDRMQRKLELEARIFDASVYFKMIDQEKFGFTPPAGKPNLISNDPLVINEFEVTLHYISSWCVFSRIFLEKLNDDAKRLMVMLQKEYR